MGGDSHKCQAADCREELKGEIDDFFKVLTMPSAVQGEAVTVHAGSWLSAANKCFCSLATCSVSERSEDIVPPRRIF